MSSLRAKLVIPYVMLTLATAMVGMFVITRLVASTLRERFANQMLEASRVAADSIVRRERVHIEELRLMAFTQGVGPALAGGDTDQLQAILFPLVLNNRVQSLTVASAQGTELISLIQDPASSEYLVSRGADLSQVELLAGPLAGVEDELGDKYAGLLTTIYGPHLFTAGPVRGGAGEVLGALMIGTRLDSLAADIKAQVLADVIILDPSGAVVTTTLAEPDGGYAVLGLAPYDIAYLDPGKTVEVTLYGRTYQIYYTPLVVRQKPVGVLGVVLPSNFIITTESISRNVFILLFTLGTLAVIITGLVLASRISKPIVRMRDVSLAVAAGDLDQRTGVRGRDEVGQMAAVFDLMTFRLRRRTAQANQLHAEALRRSEELAQANLRLQQAQAQLVQSEKLAAVGQLSAGIVHDVKNPLAVITGLTEELQENIGTESPHRTALAQIRENAVRASGIVTDLLKFARQSNPEMSHQNVWETVRSAVRLNDYMIRRANVKVQFEPLAAPVMTFYDGQQIQQVVINLIQNAVQAMPNGGTLSLDVRQTAPWVEIDVRDTGVGIPPKNLGRIYDPFFTTKPPGEGTGLGLSVSYGIVATHKGHIDVRSEVGRGTTFTVRLPLRGPDDKTLER
jgi:signal transduction histidine kinase